MTEATDRYVIGIDGGQSSTICVLGRTDGTLHGVGRAGPCNHVRQPGGMERMRSALTRSVAGALGMAPVVERLAAAYLGLTGGSDIAETLLPEIVPVDRIVAEGDTAAALAAGTLGGPGMVLIAGTGAVAMALSASGTRTTRGGWGYLIGDEGSGYWIGMEAVRAAARAVDGRGPETILIDAVPRRFGVPTIREVADLIYEGRIGRPEIAALTPSVLAAAAAGDTVAAAIAQGAARELIELVVATARAAKLTDPSEHVIVLSGGTLRAGTVLHRGFEALTHECLPGFRVIIPEFPPVIGAYFLALKLAGITLDDSVLARLRASLVAFPDIADKANEGSTRQSPLQKEEITR